MVPEILGLLSALAEPCDSAGGFLFAEGTLYGRSKDDYRESHLVRGALAR